MPKISGYIKKFEADHKINELMSFRIDYKKLLKKFKGVWTKIESLKKY